MLSRYKTYPLGNFIEQIRGVSYKKSDVSEVPKEGYIPLLRANNIQAGKLVFSDVIYVKKELVKENQLIKKGDIVIAASSGSKEVVGKSGQAHSDYDCSFGAFCKLIRAKENINPRFLGYFFKTDYYSSSISNSVNGANINNLRNEHIDNLLIPIPSISTQKKIANVLDKAQELIDKRKAQIEALDQLTQSVFFEMFGDPQFNPYHWDIIHFEEIMTDTPQNGIYKPASDYVTEGGTPILRIDSFYNGKIIDLNKLKRIKCSAREIAKYRLNEMDIVINRVNSIEYLGKCAIVENLKENTVFESNMMRIRTNMEKVNPKYLVYHLSSQFIYNQILTKAKKAVNQASINQKDVRSFLIVCPPIELQNSFAEKLSKIESFKSRLVEGLKELETNFNSLMQRAFKGELFND
jgi:type I restriction enzyme, S subunit